MTVQALTTDNFDQALQTNELLVVDFWAEWCGPCKAFGKVMAEIAAEYPKACFGSVDVEKEKSLAEEFAVRSIPFVMIVRNQVVVYAESGALSASGLRELLEQAGSLDPEKLSKTE